MANKIFLVCATLAFFFLLTNASIYRTIFEFDEDDDTNLVGSDSVSPKQKCGKEFQQAKHLRACQRWMRKQAKQGGGGRPGDMDDEFDFEDDIENPQGPQDRPEVLQNCCNELRQVDTICVCPTLKRAAKAIRLRGQHGPFQVIRIYETAKNLPDVCNIPNVDVCPFKSSPFFPLYY